MDEIITFADPQLAVRDLLRSILAARSDPAAAGATVSTKGLPGGTGTWPLPYIQVRSDGSYRDARLNGRATMRVLIWHRDEGLAQALAGLCEALLLASNSADLRGFSPVTGAIPTGDDETGLPLSFFTITARLRPHLIH